MIRVGGELPGARGSGSQLSAGGRVGDVPSEVLVTLVGEVLGDVLWEVLGDVREVLGDV